MLFINKPPAKCLSSDVSMHAVHFWGQERGLSVGRECPTCDEERKEERGEKKHPRMKYGHTNFKSFCPYTNDRCSVVKKHKYTTHTMSFYHKDTEPLYHSILCIHLYHFISVSIHYLQCINCLLQ